MRALIGTRKSGKRRGFIIAVALILGVALGGWWSGLGQSSTVQHEASSCQVFAGRGGSLPCTNKYANTSDSKAARQVAGTTVTGCALGLAGGGPVGAGFGCLGGLLSNIPWSRLGG